MPNPVPVDTSPQVVTGSSQLQNTMFDSQSIAPPPGPNATNWAFAILLGLGINPTPAAIRVLVAQMKHEDSSLSYLTGKNNPLAVTNSNYTTATPLPGSAFPGGVNSAGVQGYSNWLDGLAANIADIQANPQMLAALKDANVTCTSYGAALGQSTWEGTTPGSSANTAYGSAVADTCSSIKVPAVGPEWQSYLQSILGTAQEGELSAALGKIQAGVTNAAKAAFSWADFLSSLATRLNAIGWTGIASILVGIALLIIGLVLIFRDTVAKGVVASL